MSKSIEITTLALDEGGQPILEGIRKDRGGKLIVGSAEVKVQKLESAIISKKDQYDVYPGTKMIISVTDALDGTICPPSVILGEVVLLKGKVYELIYDSSLHIDETWQTINIMARFSAKLEFVPLYPPQIKTQSALMDLILRHESISNSPFVRLRFEHPAEIQERLDIEALVLREQGLAERRKKAEEEFKLQELQIEKDRKKLTKKINN